MSSKEEEQRDPAVAGAASRAHPSVTPAFSCRRWSRLTGKSISSSAARAWQKRSQQRAQTVPDHFDTGQESGLHTRLLPASPRPVDGMNTSGLKPLVPEHMNALVGRIYGGRASPREQRQQQRQQQRKQQLDAVKDAIYLPAVTSRSMPPPSRDRQTADRPARGPRCVTESALTDGGWLSSLAFMPPPGIKLLSTDLPELRARLIRHNTTKSSQDKCGLFFSPTPPPPEATRLSSPPSTGQTSPVSHKPHQTRRPVSQQHPRHHRKLKSRDGTAVIRAQTNEEVPGDDFAGVSSTGSLEAEIVGALEARETRDSARGFGHDRRGSKEADNAHTAARSDNSKCAATTVTGVSASEPPNEQLQEPDAQTVDERQIPSSAPEPILEQKEMNKEHSPSVDTPCPADDSGSTSCSALESSGIVQESQDQQYEPANPDCTAETLPERTEDQLSLERDIEGLDALDENEGVDLRDDGACHVHHDGGEMTHLDASAVCHDNGVAEGPHDSNDTERTERASPDRVMSISPATSTAMSIKTESDGDDRGIVGDNENSGESNQLREDATEASASAVQSPDTMGTLIESVTPIGDLENQKGEGEEVEDAHRQEEWDREVARERVDGNTDSIAGNPEDQHQLEALIVKTEVSTVDPDGPSFGVAVDAPGSDDDDYSDGGDDDGDTAAALAVQDSTATDPRLPHHPVPSLTELTPASESRDSSHLSGIVERGDNVGQTEDEPKGETVSDQEVNVADSSVRRPSVNTYDADFEDDNDDDEDTELQYYDSD